jgi:hypothetical protein
MKFSKVFVSLFAKREWVSGQSPENINKKKTFCPLFTEERFQKASGVRGNIPKSK